MTDNTAIRRRRRITGRPSGITLTDVAKVANVSEITVSRVLRNKEIVADRTRARVIAAIRQTGYVANRIAGTLASSASSNLIGVVIPSLSNIVFPEVLRGIHKASDESGMQPVIGITDYDMGVEEKLVGSLLAWKPAAMIIAGFDHTEETRRQLQRSRVRVAELMDIDSSPIDIAVGLSHRRAGYDTGRHLIKRGYRRYGYVGHDWRADRRAKLRYDGLCQALGEAGLSIIGQAHFDGASSTPAGRSMLAELLRRRLNLDVVVFSNDDMAIGGVFHCISKGIILKEDLAVFGFNGLEIGQSLPLPLSTIRSNRYLIGRIAVERLLAQPEREAAPVTIDTGYDIVEGATA